MDNDRSEAEEDLRVIRSLMERATVYRAISAPAALVASLLSIFAAAAIHLNHATRFSAHEFAVIWLIVLALSALASDQSNVRSTILCAVLIFIGSV